MKNPYVVAIDFDETIGFYPAGIKGYFVKQVPNLPNKKVTSVIKHLRKKGVKIVVYSSRWWGDFRAVRNWLKKYKIQVDDIVLGRLKADAYICDKTVNTFDKNLKENVLKMLKNSNTWGVHSK